MFSGTTVGSLYTSGIPLILISLSPVFGLEISHIWRSLMPQTCFSQVSCPSLKLLVDEFLNGLGWIFLSLHSFFLSYGDWLTLIWSKHSVFQGLSLSVLLPLVYYLWPLGEFLSERLEGGSDSLCGWGALEFWSIVIVYILFSYLTFD